MKKKRKRGFLWDLRKNWILWLFLCPTLIFFLINHYLPMAGVYMAFTDFNFKGGIFGSEFVGLKNFEFLVKGNVLGRLTINTILYNLVFIVLGNIVQLLVSIVISQISGKRFKKTVQTLILMPYFVSYVVLNVVAYNLLSYDNGLINNFAVNVFGGERLNFYTHAEWWPFILVAFYIWKGLGYGSVVYLATITGISQEYYEAAKIDGASTIQQIRYITLPALKPTCIMLVVYSVGGIVRGQFELFYQLVGENGLLYSTTDILDTYIYRATLNSVNYGMTTAAGLYQSVLGLVIVLLVNFMIRKTEPEYALF